MSNSKWRGLKALVHDGVDATVELVREGHESTSRSVRRVTDEIDGLRTPVRVVDGVRRVATNGVLGSVKMVNRAVEVVTDAGLDFAEDKYGIEIAEPAPIPLSSEVTGSLSWFGDAALAIVNGAVGDHLSTNDSNLDLAMVFRVRDSYVPLTAEALAEALPDATSKVAVFVHGLGASEWSWCLESEAYHGDAGLNFGSLLERDLGFTPIFVRYNTGRHVSENGRLLAEMMEQFAAVYPVPIEDLTILGHSMGGLVTRSACHYAEEDGLAWPALVRRVFYLGSPHQGAPLAKLGHVAASIFGAVDLPTTRILSKIIDGRSSGVKDLRHGGLVDEEWLSPLPIADRDSVPLAHVTHYFVSATITKDPEHPVGRVVGDLLVQVPSASAPQTHERLFDIETSHYGGVMHHQLQNHPGVYEQVLKACSPP